MEIKTTILDVLRHSIASFFRIKILWIMCIIGGSCITVMASKSTLDGSFTVENILAVILMWFMFTAFFFIGNSPIILFYLLHYVPAKNGLNKKVISFNDKSITDNNSRFTCEELW